MATTEAPPAVIGVREIHGGPAQDLRAIKMVWKRELIRFSRNRTRLITAPVQPLLFLPVLGTGLAKLTTKTANLDFSHLHISRRDRHERAVHGDLLGHLHRLGPRVRLHAGDAGRILSSRDAAVRASALLPFRRGVPAQGFAGVAHGPDQDRPAQRTPSTRCGGRCSLTSEPRRRSRPTTSIRGCPGMAGTCRPGSSSSSWPYSAPSCSSAPCGRSPMRSDVSPARTDPTQAKLNLACARFQV